MIGYEGDGFICTPVDPCQTDAGGCPMDSTKCVYTAPGKVSLINLFILFSHFSHWTVLRMSKQQNNGISADFDDY